MGTRSVAKILEEWRTLERELHEPMDTQQRIDLERAIAGLAEEHGAAVSAQQLVAEASSAPSIGLAEP